MRKIFLLAFVLVFSCSNASFACCGCKGSNNLSTRIYQKACQNVLALIHFDVSLLSPRASISDLEVAGPKTTCCSKKQLVIPDDCPQADPPGDKKSMTTTDNRDAIIPVANIKCSNQPCTKPQNKLSLFRVELLRIFKIQVL